MASAVPPPGLSTEQKVHEAHMDRRVFMVSLKKTQIPETREELVDIVKAAAKRTGKIFTEEDISWIVTQLWTSASAKILFSPRK